MNARLRKDFFFSAAIIFNDQFKINNYSLTLDLTTVTDNSYEHNVAYERLHYWINDVLADSILVQEGSQYIDMFKQIPVRVIEVPDAPVDQIINVILFAKLNAILENRIDVTDIELSSTVGDNVKYLHCEEESVDLELPAWCTDSSPSWNNKKTNKALKVVAFNRPQESRWKDLGLGWDETETDDHSVVVTFSKDEPK
jgi:hypothetical protein